MFKCVQTTTDLTRVLLVRAIVFMEEQGIPFVEEMDEYDLSTLHVLGEIDGEPMACGRILFTASTAKLQRLAVRKAWRGQGYGAQLLSFMLTSARSRGFSHFMLHAQLQAEHFYRRQGFCSEGPHFMEAGIPHVRMVLCDD